MARLQMKRVLSFHLLLAITMMCLRSQLEFATALGNETDRLALLAFKDSIIHDPSGVLSSWNDSLPFCQWEGVTCSKRHQRAVTLDLEAKGLLGTLSPSIGNLSFLNVINLGSNNFQGEIPKVIGNLHRLQVLNLSLNSFEGQFPANLSNCRNLKLLNFNNNGLTGNLPAALMLNKNLQILLVASNNLTGRIPPSLGNLSSLAYLVLMVNNLEGSIPYELGQLTNLKWLQLAGNKLSGTLSSSLYNLTFITQLSVAGNQLQGSIPTNIGLSFPNVQWLSIGGNHFTGSIPVSLSNATNLLLLDFSQNEFTGTVPESIGSLQGFQYLNVGFNHLGSGKGNDLDFLTSLTNCSSLQVLGLNDNDFGGVLPNSIANLSSQLKTLTLGRNQLYGSIPAGIENLVNLSTLGIERNALSGSIPYGIGKIQRLQQLELSENKITGQIPSSIGNITVMIELYLDDNDLEGNIPTTLGNCQALQVLNLSQNNLNGIIPNQILNLPYLSISLNLADNSLTGSLPLEIGNLKDIVELDISKNKLSGEIPETLGNCLTLEQLYMDRNLFEGSIPQSLSTLKSLYVLDFSHNNLTGQIPTYFENFPLLQYLNISYNNLDGEVPIEGIFSNASATSIIGNNRLCGGIPAFQLPACPAQPTERHKNSISAKVVVPVVVGVTSIIFLSIFTILCLPRLKNRSVITSMKDQVSGFSYRKLFKATDGFSSTNLIGQGSCGYVYKGILDDHGKEVAIKVLNLRGKGVLKSFTAECKALKNIRHRNLVKILGSCSSVDFNGNDFKALVFKFMPNGSLERWLHPEEEQPHQLLLLNFMQRLNIAIDVAFALEYLHFYSHTPIVHCDLKPSNVLLDDDMTAHVSDFGLARLLSETADHCQNQTTSSCIKGTIGYVAPEYGMGNEASTYGDVYSYGILLLELFTGKRPTDEMFSYGLSLHEFAKTGLAEQTLQMVDPQLLRELEEYKEHENQEMQNLDIVANKSSMINKWECLTMVIKIGVMCSMEVPGERRGMRDVVKEMQAIKDYFMGSHNFKLRL